MHERVYAHVCVKTRNMEALSRVIRLHAAQADLVQ
jgi:hypothetical protein